MTDKPDPPMRAADAPPELNDIMIPDVDVLTEAVADLNIVRKNIIIYPAIHEQVQRSLERAYKRMQSIFGQVQAMTLAVMPDGLMVGPHTLESKGSVFKELARNFRAHEIGAITFSRDLLKDELLQFLQLIIANRFDVQALGGIEAAVADRGISGITVQAVDYSKIRITEEKEIQRPGRQQAEASHWQGFVYQLLAGTPAQAEAMKEQPAAFDPIQVAGYLDRHREELPQAIAHYERTLASHAEKSGDPQLISPALAASMQNFHELIKALNPELQRQFLSVAFNHCARFGPSPHTAHLMGALGGNLVVRMLQQANADGREISPSLVAFVKTLGNLQAKGADDHQPGAQKAGDDASPADLSIDQLHTLLSRENYEHFVDDQYDQMLKGLAVNDETGRPAPAIAALRSELIVNLEESQINCHVGRILIALMEVSADLDSYRDWARQLTFVLDDLVETKNFACLLEIYQFIRTQGNTPQPDAEKGKIVELVLKHFSGAQFVAKVVACIDKPKDQVEAEAFDFAALLGEPAVVEVFECLGTKDKLDKKNGLVQLLDRFGLLAVEEALERLNDSRPRYIRMMLRIMRRLGTSELAENVRPLMEHAAHDVRLDALATLVKFNNPWGLLHLRELLQQSWSPTVQVAIRMAGHYRVQETAPLLSALVTRRGSLGADLERREAALRALGRIGDGGVLSELDKLARRRWSFSKRHLLHLKRVLFESLDGYPRKEAGELLRFGLKQKDEIIRATCERLLNRYSK